MSRRPAASAAADRGSTSSGPWWDFDREWTRGNSSLDFKVSARSGADGSGVGRGPRWSPAATVVAAGVLLAGVASLMAGHALAYDPTTWQIWGGELSHGTLVVAGGGPAWKPLPVLMDTVLAPFGHTVAAAGWLLFVRVAALCGVVAAGVIGGRVADAAGAWAASVVMLVVLGGHWGTLIATGMSEPVCASAILVAAAGFLAGRRRLVMASCLIAALLRPEAWPLLLAAAGWCCRHSRRRLIDVPAASAMVLAVPVGWFGPDLAFAGDPLRSLHRAQLATSGGPLLTAHPVLAVVHEGLVGVGVPLTLAAAISLGCAFGTARSRPLLVLAGVGVGWLVIDMAMVASHLDSGDSRYLLPGIALVAVTGALAPGLLWCRWCRCGEGRRLPAGHILTAAVAIIVLATPWRWIGTQSTGWAWQQSQSAANEALAQLIAKPDIHEAIGGGQVMTGAYQVPLVAWQLHRPLNDVGIPAERPGWLLVQAGQPANIPPHFVPVARSGSRSTGWTLWHHSALNSAAEKPNVAN